MRIRLLSCLLTVHAIVLVPGTNRGMSQSADRLPDYATGYQSPLLGKNVFVFDPCMDMKRVQAIIDSVYAMQHPRSAEFSLNRISLCFAPGKYPLTLKSGYYTQYLGLGESPEDVVIEKGLISRGFWNGNVTLNFWRSVENLCIISEHDSAVIWGVSQAAPMRRVSIKGNMVLHDRGWASGGFIADSKVEGTILAGPQQQWFTRNSSIGNWTGGQWNIMFMGTKGAPEQNWPQGPITLISGTPEVREKPYLFLKRKKLFLKIPDIRQNTSGVSWDKGNNGKYEIPLSDMYLAFPDVDDAITLNQALQQGRNILFTPGIYRLSESLKIIKRGTIVSGLGYATLVPVNGNAAVEILAEEGVVVSGITIDAGAVESETLFRIGEPGASPRPGKDPVCIHDIFIRIGGYGEGRTRSAMLINTSNTLVDHIWLWRADHGKEVAWDKNTAKNGLVVNGDKVTIYGLFNEHFQEYQTLWNGNLGRMFFYQCEMPYDPPDPEIWKHGDTYGYAGYKVSDHVTSHEAWGLGIYNVFYKAPVIVDQAIETPFSLESHIHHKIIFWLNGNEGSVVRSIINGKGAQVDVNNRKSVME